MKEGAVGAGTGATVGKLLGMRQAKKSGKLDRQPFRSKAPWRGVLVSALVAVNAVGDIRDPQSGSLIAGARRSAESLSWPMREQQMKRGLRGVVLAREHDAGSGRDQRKIE